MECISGYRIMWIFIVFDLPTLTKEDRKNYTKFRKDILKMGFDMHQYSVYIKCCPSFEVGETLIRKVENALPQYGDVSLISLTDKQFGNIRHFWGAERKHNFSNPGQILLF